MKLGTMKLAISSGSISQIVAAFPNTSLLSGFTPGDYLLTVTFNSPSKPAVGLSPWVRLGHKARRVSWARKFQWGQQVAKAQSDHKDLPARDQLAYHIYISFRRTQSRYWPKRQRAEAALRDNCRAGSARWQLSAYGKSGDLSRVVICNDNGPGTLVVCIIEADGSNNAYGIALQTVQGPRRFFLTAAVSEGIGGPGVLFTCDLYGSPGQVAYANYAVFTATLVGGMN